jgi:hypothetical protein
MKSKGAREPSWIDANQSSFLHAFLKEVEPSLLARKGTLHLLCAQDVEEAVAAAVYECYYSDNCFDILPSLRRALATACLEQENAQEAILAAVVTRDVDAFVLAAQEIVAWLGRFGEVREVLNASRTRAFDLGAAGDEHGDGEMVLRGVRCHLGMGDILLLTTREAIEAASVRRLRRLLRGEASPQAIVRAVGRSAQPAAIIEMPGFSPVPAMESPPTQLSPEPKRAPMAPREGHRSPIWLTLLVAVLSVALVFWWKEPALSRGELSGLLSWALTPVPTPVASPTFHPTPQETATALKSTGTSIPTLSVVAQPVAAPGTREAIPTLTPPTPTEVSEYPPIKLLHPAPDEEVHSFELALSWDWDGELGEKEYFDVRLWRLGEPEKSIVWTKEREYVERLPSRGWHSWRVRLVRGQEGIIEEVLTQTLATNFDWTPDGGSGPDPTATPVPPTRATVEQRPTRVTPAADGEDAASD